MPSLERLKKYARLLVTAGVNVRPGQELVVQGPVERADFVRLAVAAGYEAGAGHVTVMWTDDAIKRLTYENVELEYFKTVPAWRREQLDSLARMGAAFLWLDGESPSALVGIDAAKPAAASKATNTQCKAYRHGMDFGENAWCIAGVPTLDWAATVFPDEEPTQAVEHLWDAILDVARVTDDPIAAWERHNESFERQKSFMNEQHFDRLHYTSSNGTDLTVGLTDRHVWEGGASRSVDGAVYPHTRFFPNIPTEEVFTSPDRLRVDGVVHSALPLIHRGNRVDDFWLRFEGGAVVEYDAAVGLDVLKQIIETDENSMRLGECALISKNTPIRQLGVLFYNTLYDENASCHLALGKGFPECYEGGLDLSEEELLAHGINQSATHVDFMIGADDLDIVGIKPDGTEVQVFAHGQWAWE